MEERIEISILLDFYGELLTDKQKNIMRMYYNEDLSLAEIAELNNISRQAVHDLIKRCYKQLLAYEEKLNLMKKSFEQKKIKNEILEELYELNHQSEAIIDEQRIKKIEQLVKTAM